MSIINPFTVVVTFAIILAVLAYFRPKTGRIVTGIFFLTMALGVNVPIIIYRSHFVCSYWSQSLSTDIPLVLW